MRHPLKIAAVLAREARLRGEIPFGFVVSPGDHAKVAECFDMLAAGIGVDIIQAQLIEICGGVGLEPVAFKIEPSGECVPVTLLSRQPEVTLPQGWGFTDNEEDKS